MRAISSGIAFRTRNRGESDAAKLEESSDQTISEKNGATGARGALAAIISPAHGQSPTATKKILIDTDPGTDDALAILLALNSPEIDVRAITIVAGNVTSELGLENALKVMSLAGRCEISVAKGATHPLFQKLNTEEFWNGKNGLGGAELPPSHCAASSQFGPDLIIEMVHRYPHEITLVPIGPLTNIALAISKDPSIIPLVKEVVLMGGLDHRRECERCKRIQHSQ